MIPHVDSDPIDPLFFRKAAEALKMKEQIRLQNESDKIDQAKKNLLDRGFIEIPLTPEENLNLRMWAQYTKFQTSTYIAYIHSTTLPYITPDHLERPGESVAMQEARKLNWGKPLDREICALEGKHPYEESLVTDEWHELDRMWMEDHREKFPELAEEYDKITSKYTILNYLQLNIPLMNKITAVFIKISNTNFTKKIIAVIIQIGNYTDKNYGKIIMVSTFIFSVMTAPYVAYNFSFSYQGPFCLPLIPKG